MSIDKTKMNSTSASHLEGRDPWVWVSAETPPRHRRAQAGGEAVSDRELLELAAKAAGIRGGIWNPLTDDGDALRLMVKLHMCVTSFSDEQMVGYVKNGVGYNVSEAHGLDAYAATRRAIVRAAAEIGRNMP